VSDPCGNRRSSKESLDICFHHLHRAFVTFITAGFPNADSTVPLMLAMEAGGADIIELGVPFSDPIADGPAIQGSNTVRHATTHNRFRRNTD
jgi:tryptophan synthase alpha subunit